MTVVASVEDPDGRSVELTEERWRHVEEVHPEIAGLVDDVMATVSDPHRRSEGREAGEQWFYREGLGPTRWLKVVVSYGEERGFIVTAHGRRSFP